MANKFYSVRKGKTVGIFESWSECEVQVKGFPNAEYKSFKTREEALSYLKNDNSMIISSKSANTIDAEIYVDGSYNSVTNEFSYGMVVLRDNKELKFAQKFNDKDLAKMHNVAGEIKGAEAAMTYAVKNSLKNITIYHDYEGISKWCLGEWKANKDATRSYKSFFENVKDKVNIKFIKVTGHSNDKYNDMADELAKQALGLCNTPHNVQDTDLISENLPPTNKSIYIVRDIDKLNTLLDDTVKGLFPAVICKGLSSAGNHKRYTFEVDNVEYYLDVYQKNNGQTTLQPVGNNIHLSNKLKETIELRGYRANIEQKSFSIFIGNDWLEKTIQYLEQLCDGNKKIFDENDKKRLVFVSDIGDRLTLIVYNNNKVLVQGKPLYLYNEFLSFVSYSPKVEMNDILEATNEFIETDTDIDSARSKLAELMPTAYTGDVDDVIWKLFTPSISLIDTNKSFEDYSCFAFPSLRALEGYLKYLLDLKNIVIGQ